MKSLRNIILSTMIFMLMVIASSSSVFATTELAYDDGTAESSMDGETGIENAVRFSLQPGWSSAKILTARYFIGNNPAIFRLHVYDDDGTTDLTAPFDITPVGTGWFDVDLTARNIVVTGDFFISIEYLNDYQPAIGVDQTMPIDLRTYSKDIGESWEVTDFGDLMIRAVVDPNVPVGGVMMPTEKLEILTPYTALAALIAMVSVVYIIKKRKD